MKDSFLKALKSRTVWTVVVLFIFSGLEGVRETVGADWARLVDGLLSFMAIYFRVNAKE